MSYTSNRNTDKYVNHALNLSTVITRQSPFHPVALATEDGRICIPEGDTDLIINREEHTTLKDMSDADRESTYVLRHAHAFDSLDVWVHDRGNKAMCAIVGYWENPYNDAMEIINPNWIIRYYNTTYGVDCSMSVYNESSAAAITTGTQFITQHRADCLRVTEERTLLDNIRQELIQKHITTDHVKCIVEKVTADFFEQMTLIALLYSQTRLSPSDLDTLQWFYGILQTGRRLSKASVHTD